MLLAAFSAVIASLSFPSTLYLNTVSHNNLQAPGSLADILKNAFKFYCKPCSSNQ